MLSFAWEELLIMFVALALGGLFKGMTGLGLPLITIPVMATFLGVERAVLIMLIPSSSLNAYQVWMHRSEWANLPEWPRLLLAGIPGAALGATVLYLANEKFLMTSLAVWIAAYVLLRFLHPTFSLSRIARLRWSPLVGAAAAALQSATGISAPIIAPYADSLGLKPRAYVLAVCAPFGAFAGAHLLIVSTAGLYSGELATQGLVAVLPAVMFIPVGVYLRRFISPQFFDVLIRLTLLVMAGRLVYGAWFSS